MLVLNSLQDLPSFQTNFVKTVLHRERGEPYRDSVVIFSENNKVYPFFDTGQST